MECDQHKTLQTNAHLHFALVYKVR